MNRSFCVIIITFTFLLAFSTLIVQSTLNLNDSLTLNQSTKIKINSLMIINENQSSNLTKLLATGDDDDDHHHHNNKQSTNKILLRNKRRNRRSILVGALDLLFAPLKAHLLDMKESLKSPIMNIVSSANVPATLTSGLSSAASSSSAVLNAATAYLSSLPLVSSYDFNLLPFSVGRQCDTRVLLDAQYGQCRTDAAEYWEAAEFNVASPIDAPRLCCFVWARLNCMENAVRRVCSDPYSRNNFLTQSSALKTRLESPIGTIGSGICYYYQSSSIRCQLPSWTTVILLIIALLFAIFFVFFFIYLLRLYCFTKVQKKHFQQQYKRRDVKNEQTKQNHIEIIDQDEIDHDDSDRFRISDNNSRASNSTEQKSYNIHGQQRRRYNSRKDTLQQLSNNNHHNNHHNNHDYHNNNVTATEFSHDTYRATPVSVYIESPRAPIRVPSPHHVRYAYINKTSKQVTI